MTQVHAPDLVERLIGTGPIAAGGAGLVGELCRLAAAYPVTPLERVDVEVAGRRRAVWLKLEGNSPWGSIKGRTAIGLLASVAEVYQPGSRLVESSSGNLGVALAALARACGAQLTVVVDERLPAALRHRMTGLGADLVGADQAPGVSDLQRRLDTIQRLLRAHPDWIWLDQYDNPANPRTHQLWTAPELLTQLPDFQAAFVGVSTGGTLAGMAACLHRAAPATRIVGVDVEGSTAFGGTAGRRILTGIGASRVSTHLLTTTLDAVCLVNSWTAIGCCRAFAEATGYVLGGSSGAVLAACLQEMAADEELVEAVCLCPDLGLTYRDTIYNDQWIERERGFLDRVVPSPQFGPSRNGVTLATWRTW
ncbi:cysteine synthase family protein [Jatrophihabitans sp.]|uniref:cysteine synthase family protein n=1 Tax=Jatrophihabitans sp. TaxID=1932789 RepID=UPI002BA3EB6F|nr:cysteine synthase family protein [Jatrophihabitans sp.]